MNDNEANELLQDDSVGFCSLNSEDIVLEGLSAAPKSTMSPSLLAWLEYERDRIKNPTKPASMPRPGPKPPARAE